MRTMRARAERNPERHRGAPRRNRCPLGPSSASLAGPRWCSGAAPAGTPRRSSLRCKRAERLAEEFAEHARTDGVRRGARPSRTTMPARSRLAAARDR